MCLHLLQNIKNYEKKQTVLCIKTSRIKLIVDLLANFRKGDYEALQTEKKGKNYEWQYSVSNL